MHDYCPLATLGLLHRRFDVLHNPAVTSCAECERVTRLMADAIAGEVEFLARLSETNKEQQ